jgi:hypothetical protein
MTVADLIEAWYAAAGTRARDEVTRRLARVLVRLGPVIYEGSLCSATCAVQADAPPTWTVCLNAHFALHEFARHPGPDGSWHYDRARIPPDAVLAGRWGYPAAAQVEVPVDWPGPG